MFMCSCRVLTIFPVLIILVYFYLSILCLHSNGIYLKNVHNGVFTYRKEVATYVVYTKYVDIKYLSKVRGDDEQRWFLAAYLIFNSKLYRLMAKRVNSCGTAYKVDW